MEYVGLRARGHVLYVWGVVCGRAAVLRDGEVVAAVCVCVCEREGSV